MKKPAKSSAVLSRKTTRSPKPQHRVEPAATRPGGKLGLIVDCLAAKAGVTADELVEATGWQRHSVLGALSKLKSRGVQFHLDVKADRKAYRLSERKG